MSLDNKNIPQPTPDFADQFHQILENFRAGNNPEATKEENRLLAILSTAENKAETYRKRPDRIGEIIRPLTEEAPSIDGLCQAAGIAQECSHWAPKIFPAPELVTLLTKYPGILSSPEPILNSVSGIAETINQGVILTPGNHPIPDFINKPGFSDLLALVVSDQSRLNEGVKNKLQQYLDITQGYNLAAQMESKEQDPFTSELENVNQTQAIGFAQALLDRINSEGYKLITQDTDESRLTLDRHISRLAQVLQLASGENTSPYDFATTQSGSGSDLARQEVRRILDTIRFNREEFFKAINTASPVVPNAA